MLTTINRTNLSWAAAIVAAEYITGLVPIGTHDWHRFVKPSEAKQWMMAAGVSPIEVRGFGYNPVCKDWFPSEITAINYGMFGVKTAE